MHPMSAHTASPDQPDLLRSGGRDSAVGEAQGLLAWPFFSLAKPMCGGGIDVPIGDVSLPPEAIAEHALVAIRDADVRIRVVSRVVEARGAGRTTSPIIAATPPEILAFTRRPASNASHDRPNAGRGPQLTDVTLVWQEGLREDWLKFGKPVASRIIDRRQRIESYAADQVFGLVRWASNEYGTVRSALDIVRALEAGEPCTPVAQVDPGGEVLLSVHGWPKVAQVFRLIDAIEASGIDPCEVAPDHWRHIHNRLAARERPRDYSPARHCAWLKRKPLLP